MKVGFDVRVSALCLLLAPTVSSTGAAETVADTKFSVNRGFYVIPFRVKISSVTPDAEIRYTTDGSEPALNHGSGGPSPQLVEVTTTTVLRAKAFREGLEPTNVDTQTYLFTNHVLEQPDEIPGYPSLVMRTSGSTSATLDYGMDPEIARDPAYRERLLDGLESIPSISLVLPKEHMFGHGGIYYATDGNGPTHAASVEVLYADEPDASFRVDCGLESHATVAVKRSFKLKFQSEFGPGKLVTPFFRGSPLNGDSATTVIDRIVLRAGNERSFALRGYPHRTTYARDEWARDSQIAMTGAGSRGLFVHLYINGLYWGLYNAVERPDAWFTSAYFGGTPDDWAVVNHGGARVRKPDTLGLPAEGAQKQEHDRSCSLRRARRILGCDAVRRLPDPRVLRRLRRLATQQLVRREPQSRARPVHVFRLGRRSELGVEPSSRRRPAPPRPPRGTSKSISARASI